MSQHEDTIAATEEEVPVMIDQNLNSPRGLFFFNEFCGKYFRIFSRLCHFCFRPVIVEAGEGDTFHGSELICQVLHIEVHHIETRFGSGDIAIRLGEDEAAAQCCRSVGGFIGCAPILHGVNTISPLGVDVMSAAIDESGLVIEGQIVVETIPVHQSGEVEMRIDLGRFFRLAATHLISQRVGKVEDQGSGSGGHAD